MIQAQFNREKFMSKVAEIGDEALAAISTGIFGNYCFDISIVEGGTVSAPPSAKRGAPHDGSVPPAAKLARKARAAKELSEDGMKVIGEVYTYLRANNGSRLSDIATGIGADKGDVTAALKLLQRESKARGNGKKGTGARYYVVEQAEA